MKRKTCPYLGLQDDPTTALGFPSEGNFCHHALPVAAVDGSYQEKYCLTPGHFSCPVYQAARPIPLPDPISTAPSTRDRRRVMALLAVPLLLVGISALALGWSLISGLRGGDPRPIPETGGSASGSGDIFSLGLFQDEEGQTPFVPFKQVTPMEATLENCPMQEDWITYVVNPTDSLYRLSVIYGLSIEEFQQVNCMGSQSVILPGQVIYVPFMPTNTPITRSTGSVRLGPTATIRPPVIRPPNQEATSVASTKSPATRVAPSQTSVAINIPTSAPTRTSAPSIPPTSVPPTATNRPPATNTPVPTRTSPPVNTLVPTLPPSPTKTSAPPPTKTSAPPPTKTSAPPPPPATETSAPPPPPATETSAPPPPPATETSAPPPPPPTEPADTPPPEPVNTTPPDPVDTPPPEPADTPPPEPAGITIIDLPFLQITIGNQ